MKRRFQTISNPESKICDARSKIPRVPAPVTARSSVWKNIDSGLTAAASVAETEQNSTPDRPSHVDLFSVLPSNCIGRIMRFRGRDIVSVCSRVSSIYYEMTQCLRPKAVDKSELNPYSLATLVVRCRNLIALDFSLVAKCLKPAAVQRLNDSLKWNSSRLQFVSFRNCSTLSSCELDGFLRRTPNLLELDLRGCTASSPSLLRRLPCRLKQLESLFVGNEGSPTDVDFFDETTRWGIKRLVSSGAPPLASIGKACQQLETLEVHLSAKIPAEDLPKVFLAPGAEAYSVLKSIRICGAVPPMTPMSFKWLRDRVQLQCVILNITGLQDNALVDLFSDDSSLQWKHVDLCDTDITGTSIAGVLYSCPKLESLAIRNCWRAGKTVLTQGSIHPVKREIGAPLRISVSDTNISEVQLGQALEARGVPTKFLKVGVYKVLLFRTQTCRPRPNIPQNRQWEPWDSGYRSNYPRGPQTHL